MPGPTTVQLSFPEFSGITRQLVLWNVGAVFALALIGVFNHDLYAWIVLHLAVIPKALLSGELWQPLTYSFIHPMSDGILGIALEILSLWYLVGFLQSMHGSGWVTWLYAASVVGAALTAALTYYVGQLAGLDPPNVLINGATGGLIGLMSAIGLLHGEAQFQLIPFPISIKAKYLAMIYIVVAVAFTFTSLRMFAFSQLGGALAALLYVRYGSRRGVGFELSEGMYGLRNRFYRWKRRKAAKNFEVYMQKQGRTVKFDGQGRKIDDDRTGRDRDDRSRWN